MGARSPFRCRRFRFNAPRLGSHGADKLLGGNSNDYEKGSAGDDVIKGSLGDDFLVAKAGDDVILGGEGRDVILAGFGNDTARGGNGIDTIRGSNSNDGLFGSAGAPRAMTRWQEASVSTRSSAEASWLSLLIIRGFLAQFLFLWEFSFREMHRFVEGSNQVAASPARTKNSGSGAVVAAQLPVPITVPRFCSKQRSGSASPAGHRSQRRSRPSLYRPHRPAAGNDVLIAGGKGASPSFITTAGGEVYHFHEFLYPYSGTDTIVCGSGADAIGYRATELLGKAMAGTIDLVKNFAMSTDKVTIHMDDPQHVAAADFNGDGGFLTLLVGGVDKKVVEFEGRSDVAALLAKKRIILVG
ncbi:unnamed protein product [Phaeothamnion confervicola]